MTDQELMLLEMVSYLDGAYSNAGITAPSNPQSVADFVNQLSEDDLAKLDAMTDKKCGSMYGKQWSALVREIKSDENLMSLQLVAMDKESGSYCFADPEDTSGKAYVVFRGTVDGDEWKDDCEGLTQTDTDCQKEAKEFVEGLPAEYTDLTAVGHSKGGNKAQYVTITTDRVKYCVSMDGQGFSQEFIDKYWAEIEEKGGCIKNYSLTTDYVHILLFPVPGASQIYCSDDGTGAMRKGGLEHSPAAYFQYYQDENGQWHVVEDASGNANLYIADSEEEGMTYLREFVYFVANTATMKEKEQLAEYIGTILALAMRHNETFEYNGVVYGYDDLTALILSDPECASILLAYLIKYIELAGLTDAQIQNLLECFGLTPLLTAIEVMMQEHPVLSGAAMGSIKGLLEFLLEQLSDGEEDPIIIALLGELSKWLYSEYEITIDAGGVWESVEKHYNSIPDVDINKATSSKPARSGKIYNYSEEAFSTFVSAADAIAANTFGSVSSWQNYSNQEWYASLSIGLAIKGITYYYDHIADICNDCKSQVSRVFDSVSSVDADCAEKMIKLADEINSLSVKIRDHAERLA